MNSSLLTSLTAEKTNADETAKLAKRKMRPRILAESINLKSQRINYLTK